MGETCDLGIVGLWDLKGWGLGTLTDFRTKMESDVIYEGEMIIYSYSDLNGLPVCGSCRQRTFR